MKEIAKADGLTVIILTYNEEPNIPYALENVVGWAEDVFVLDSYSNDKTVEICEEKGAKVFFNKFEDFYKQRHHALTELPIKTEWVFFLDADEYIFDDTKSEISEKIKSDKFDAYHMKRRFYWMGKWIKRGYYPTWLLRLGRTKCVEWDKRPINEHMICTTGKIGILDGDFVDHNRKGLTEWIAKHNDYSTREAWELINKDVEKYNFFGGQYERKRWLRKNIWAKMPPVIRPFFYFCYRYFFRLGFLDGKEAFLYHFIHAYIYRTLIDFKYLEIKWLSDKAAEKKKNEQ